MKTKSETVPPAASPRPPRESVTTRRQANALVHRCGPTLLGFVLLYQAVFQLVVAPLGQAIWGGAVALSPTKYIVSDNLAGLFRSPLVLLAGLVLGVGWALWALVEIAGILLCLEYSFQGRSIGLVALLRLALTRCAPVLRLQNLPLLLFTALVVPFTDFLMTSRFIRQLVVPEYIMEVILASPLYLLVFTAVLAAATLWTVAWLFVFHYFLLEQCSLPQAAARSVALVRGHRLRSVCRVLFWKITKRIKYGVLTGLPLVAIWLLLYFAVSDKTLLAAWQVSSDKILIPITQYLVGALVAFAQYSMLSVLFHRYQALRGDTAPVLPPEKPRRAKKPLAARHYRWLPAALSIAVSLLGAAGTAVIALALYCGIDLLPATATVMAHRGYSAVAPENTLPAFQAAIDTGCTDYAELDVMQTSDGVVVVTHDTNLKRCTGVDANVYDLSYAEVEALDAGHLFSPEFTGTRIPTLEQVIQLCKGKIKLNIEIKNNGHAPTLESEVVRIIQENEFGDQCLITSLSYDSLVKVKEADPALKTGYILAMGVGNYYDLPAADAFSVETTFITSDMVSAIHQRGKEVYAWTVDEEQDARRMRDCGVDSIITGNPTLIHAIAREDAQNMLTILSWGSPATENGRSLEDLSDLLAGA